MAVTDLVIMLSTADLESLRSSGGLINGIQYNDTTLGKRSIASSANTLLQLIAYRDGFMDYNHSGSTQSYTSGDLKVLNDGAGAYSQNSFKPVGVTELWNTTTNQFDFSDLAVGDEVMLRTDGIVTTSTNNQEFGTKINFDIGGTTYPMQLGHSEFKAAGTYPIVRNVSFYIGNAGTRDNPAELIFQSGAAATIQLNGFYISVRRRP